MYFTLAVSAVTAEECAMLADRARIADPGVMPVPGPPSVVWRAADGRAAMLRWGGAPGDELVLGTSLAAAGGLADASAGIPVTSHAGTIWAGFVTPGDSRAPVYARTSLTRVDPVYVAEVPGGVILSDRATRAAWTARRLGHHDPMHLCALLNLGFPVGSVTPFRKVSALPPATTLHVLSGTLSGTTTPIRSPVTPADPDAAHRNPDAIRDSRGVIQPYTGHGLDGRAATAANALVAAVAPLREAGVPVEVSLTGGKDSRLVIAAMIAAGVPVRARTHGFPDHPDVVIAAEIARRLGVEHEVRMPAAPGEEIDVLGRIRATVLVADGMLSAFENVGRPDPQPSAAVTAGGHGGELLRGGYAETAAGRLAVASPHGLRTAIEPARRAARAAELLRRLTTRHLGLLRRGTAASYLVSLAPWSAALARGPLQALDDFYLVNRAGRWSAAARQAYLIRESLIQPLFDERVVLAARAVPIADRVSGGLSRAVLAELCPALLDVPLAGKAPARAVTAGSEPGGRTPLAAAPATGGGGGPTPDGGAAKDAAAGGPSASFDWRRDYGEEVASFLRDYILDQGTSSGLFDVISRSAADRLLAAPHADPSAVWALATLACLVSGDYRNARTPSSLLSVT